MLISFEWNFLFISILIRFQLNLINELSICSDDDQKIALTANHQQYYQQWLNEFSMQTNQLKLFYQMNAINIYNLLIQLINLVMHHLINRHGIIYVK